MSSDQTKVPGISGDNDYQNFYSRSQGDAARYQNVQ